MTAKRLHVNFSQYEFIACNPNLSPTHQKKKYFMAPTQTPNDVQTYITSLTNTSSVHVVSPEMKKGLNSDKQRIESSSSFVPNYHIINRKEYIMASSRVNFNFLSNEAKAIRMRNMKQAWKEKVRRKDREILRLKKVLKTTFDKEELTSDDGKFINFLRTVFGDISQNGSNHLKSIIIEVMLKDNVKVRSENNDIKIREFAEHITQNIANFTKTLNSKHERSTEVRFSPKMIRITLSLYCKSPSGYKDLAESSFEIFPSESLLRKMKSKINHKDGYNPRIYGDFLDDLLIAKHGSSDSNDCLRKGHIMCDEIKLKSGIYWNCKTHSIMGFASDTLVTMDLRNELKSIFNEIEMIQM